MQMVKYSYNFWSELNTKLHIKFLVWKSELNNMQITLY